MKMKMFITPDSIALVCPVPTNALFACTSAVEIIIAAVKRMHLTTIKITENLWVH
jgi:hypothetical protein